MYFTDEKNYVVRHGLSMKLPPVVQNIGPMSAR
jgi:hypothetical protein